ncbi:hypothetical protein C500_11440 [Natrialba magadii ATCC 43099]|uniref:Uncharacterized protein n=2 Tax=Natrialba magadii (strain ATCC 43099 / DSM 3394 / CCM 3739 / CIP 104546 / IAM 13178 / JCM 8861 / NBRC 102185 / NCIMB 2190 / MS3) TaxID=547559 RepID=L9UYX0_NATMM|nr:hypothetical protein C500_11440 [Natrialba magadii ATCC 43099]
MNADREPNRSMIRETCSLKDRGVGVSDPGGEEAEGDDGDEGGESDGGESGAIRPQQIADTSTYCLVGTESQTQHYDHRYGVRCPCETLWLTARTCQRSLPATGNYIA